MNDDPLVCHCIQIRRSRLLHAIAEGASTVDALRRATGACTGCQTCRPDLERLLSQAGFGSAKKAP